MCDNAITTLQIATNYTTVPTRDLADNSTYILISNCFSFLSLSKAMKNSKGVQEKEQIMIFLYIYCKHLAAWLLFASRAEKTPGHLFVVKFYGRVNTIKVISNQSVNSAAKENQINASSSTLYFRTEAYITKIFYNALKFVSCRFV